MSVKLAVKVGTGTVEHTNKWDDAAKKLVSVPVSKHAFDVQVQKGEQVRTDFPGLLELLGAPAADKLQPGATFSVEIERTDMLEAAIAQAVADAKAPLIAQIEDLKKAAA